MADKTNFEVIIVGGSYAGLAAGMALGRAMRKVLIIDDGKPCNRQTPYSHNFLTNDGKTPSEISVLGKWQVSQYDTVHFFNGTAIDGQKTSTGFQVMVATGEIFSARRLIFATGISDMHPAIDGFAACWGISVIHCPYCHGYEVRFQKTGILGNGDMGFDFARLISNWTKDLTLITNGPSLLNSGQREKLQQHHIAVIEKEIENLKHTDGHLQGIHFKDGSSTSLKVLYAPAPFEQHCRIPETLGCALTEEGYIQIDNNQETTIAGLYAIGDNTTKMRTVANAVAMGTSTGMLVSKKMILDEF